MHQLSDKELIKELENRFVENEKAMLELKSLTSQLTMLNKQLEESEKLKSHFLSNIRNEIINPFAAILGLSSNLMNLNSYDLEQIKHILSLIHTEAFQLDFQLRNIFAAAEIEAGESILQINKVDIVSVVEQTVESFRHICNKKNVSIVLNNNIEKESGITSFQTDQVKLQIILANVISNAIQFSYEKSEINIDTELNEFMLIVTIKDSGIGITKEDEKSIFDRFKKIDSKINTLNKGHGLGLSVCNDFIEMLNGSIELISTPNKGSQFIIKIIANTDLINQNTIATDGNTFLFEDGELF